MLFILAECRELVRRHRLYFLAPLLIALAVLSFLVFQIGPALIVAFVYAGL
jgi:hypothetical protein